jgi:hypothetical protein
VWRGLVLVLVAACSFRTHEIERDAARLPGPDAPVDVPRILVDAGIDVPPDACSDSDNDGTCDSVDDWPCGVKPNAPSTTVTMKGNSGKTVVTLTSISAGGSQMLVTAAGAPFQLGFNYAITDTACTSACIDQVEIGYIPGGRIGCMFDGVVSRSNGVTGSISRTEVAPSTPGSYDLRANIGQNNSCGTTTSWWLNAPPDQTRTIAKVCVH